MNHKEDLQNLIQFFKVLKLDIYTYHRYENICLVLIDSILQAGLKYSTVILPRINRFTALWTNCQTLSQLKFLIKNSASYVLNWTHHEKINRFESLVNFLSNKGIDNIDDLKTYLTSHSNRADVLKLKGIGPKTVDYMYKLSGGQEIPIDRHLISFLNLSGINVSINDYQYAQELFYELADHTNILPADLDQSIWIYMSGRKDEK